MTLGEFLSQTEVSQAWIEHDEFSELYMRQGPFIHNANRVDDSIQIGNAVAKDPGTGAFTRLLTWLRESYPDRLLYIESVQSERLANFLRKSGFQPAALPDCYYFSNRVDWK